MMNKFKLFIISLCTIIGIGICNASNVESLITELYSGSNNYSNAGYTNVFNYGNNGAGTYCIKFESTNAQTLTMGFANGGTTTPTNLYTLYNDQYGNYICLYGNKPYLNVKLNSSSNTIDYSIFKLTDLLDTTIPSQNCPTCSCPMISIWSGTTQIERIINTNNYSVIYLNYKYPLTYSKNSVGNTLDIYFTGNVDTGYCTGNNLCPTCQTCNTMTSLECETEYNLIPIANVTENYCTTNFNLIHPSSCPICEGSGAVNWSSLFINNIQYSSNDNISIDIPDDIGYDITYTDYETNVYVEGYNADEDYINAIIDNERLTPTTEDFAYLIQNLGEYIPLIFVAVLFVCAWNILKKVFK